MPTMTARLPFAMLVLLLLLPAAAAAQEFNLPKGPCGSAPPAKTHRRKGGESFPPLPLPATPLRRTEKKRPPAPPPLVAKIQFGGIKEVERDGEALRYYDWNKDPGDAAVLVGLANRRLGIRYTQKRGPLEAFPPDPARYPIYYFTGSDDFTLSERQVARLRKFLQSGGIVWGDTCFGDPDFFRAFTREMKRVLPGRKWRRLGPRHPLLHSHYDVERVGYTRPVPEAEGKDGRPVLMGLDLGDRTAVVLSRYDLSCGWDGHVREGAFSVHPQDARRLGVNMIAYALATWRLARYQGTLKVFYEEDRKARGDFVFAQARLSGNWDTQPNAVANLLKAVAARTSAEVKFRRRAVDLVSEELQQYPFLYLTGRHGFTLSDAQVRALRHFLSSGGFLLASPSAGRREFDAAFRREIGRVLEGSSLRKLPPEHPAYHIVHRLDEVRYADYVRSEGEQPPAHPLEGARLGGVTAVVYCPYGLGSGWRGFEHPFGRDVAPEDALKLGVNLVLYAMTH
ncbi:MAG: DUF4159 domain-containing protein [Planctomycetota bacterium]